MKKVSAVLASLTLTVTLSACSAGNADLDLIGQDVATTFDPAVDGFSFPNFMARDYDEEFDVEDLTSMVGTSERVCVDAVADPCVLTQEAQLVIQRVNDARYLGHCEGMIVIAAQRFDLETKVKTADLNDDPEVVNAIIKAFATMFFPEVTQQTRDWTAKSLTETVAILAESLMTGKLDYGMGLYTQEGGHEVLPYAIRYPAPEFAEVLVYDSNWPGVTRIVEIDLESQTWRFSFAAADQASDDHAWTGTHEDLDLNSNKVRLAAIASRLGETERPTGILWD